MKTISNLLKDILKDEQPILDLVDQVIIEVENYKSKTEILNKVDLLKDYNAQLVLNKKDFAEVSALILELNILLSNHLGRKE